MSKATKRQRKSLLGSTGLGSGCLWGRGAVAFLSVAVGGVVGLAPHNAKAFNIYNGVSSGNNLEINLNTTISYTGIVRTNNPSARLTSAANANGSEGDINFAHGLVSDEFGILPILDIKDGSYGAHFSGEAYVNTSYLGTNQNNQPYTLNPISVAKNTDFTSATRNVEGLNARVLDAFVYGTKYFGADQSRSVTLKVGRQTLLWGQSLFLANNGLSAGMAPFDIITSDNNPNAQTQQKIEPTGQAVLTFQVNNALTLQGYYQFEWEHDYIEGVGAYFSTTDILDKGGQRLLLPPSIGGSVLRSKDLSPENNNGQFGVSAQLELGDYDLGIFGIRYDSKAPTVYLNPGRSYYLVYPRDIWAEAVSLSTNIGAANVAGEISARQHMNLDDQFGNLAFNPTANANSNPAYPVGDTWAAQVSAIYVSPGIPLDPGGVTMDGEIGFNHVLKVTRNSRAPFGLSALQGFNSVTQGRTSTAADMQVVVTPTYYDVLPNLQLGFPVGFAYNLYGRSEIDPTENHGTGSINFGVTATYKVVWIASFTFNDYLGAPNPGLQGVSELADRNYVLFNLQHSF